MEKKTLSQKLYFLEGMSVDKISSLLDLKKSEVKAYVKQQNDFQIKNGQGSYEFRVLKGDSISKYSAANYKPFFDSILDQSNIISDFERYYRKYDILGIPEIRTFLKYFFGDALNTDNYKGSFRYIFEIKPKEIDEYQDEIFLFSILDIKSGLNFHIFNRQEQDNPAELSEFEIETIEFFFI